MKKVDFKKFARECPETAKKLLETLEKLNTPYAPNAEELRKGKKFCELAVETFEEVAEELRIPKRIKKS